MANDLRLILTTYQNSLNLERTGDLAKNIAKIVVKNDLVFDHKVRGSGNAIKLFCKI